MFDKIRLNDNLKEKYKEMMILNSKQKELCKDFKGYCKSKGCYSKEIIDYVILLINSVTTLKDFNTLYYEFYKIKETMPTAKQPFLFSTFKSIINVIRRRFVTNKSDLLYANTNARVNVFDLLDSIEVLEDKVSVLKANSIYNTLLLEDKESNELNILFVLNILTNSDNTTFINYMYDDILNSNDPYNKKILKIIMSKKLYLDINVEKKIMLLIDTLNNQNNNLNKDNLLSFVSFLISQDDWNDDEIYNFDIEIIDLILKKISSKNAEFMLEVIKDGSFNDIESLELKKEIINTILKINISDDEYKNNIKKIISSIISTNTDLEYANFILKKLKDIKSNNSLKMIIELNAFMESYVTQESKAALIETLACSEKPKKLELILKDN